MHIVPQTKPCRLLSWFIATYSSTVQKLLLKRSDTLASYASGPLRVIVGGRAETCYWQWDETLGSGWLVLGTGIEHRGAEARLMNREDWQRRLSATDARLDELDGHFTVLRWNDQKLEMFCDQLGLRGMFFASFARDKQPGVVVSSRLDWVAQLSGHQTPDMQAMASLWNCHNQLNYRSLIEGVQRCGPGAVVSFDLACASTSSGADSVRAQLSRNFSLRPTPSADAADAVIQSVDRLIDACRGQNTWSLGLSGGIDSRFLLSTLLSAPHPGAQVHVLGDADNPDVAVARQLAEIGGIAMQHIPSQPIATESLYELCSNFIAQNGLVESGSAYARYRGLETLSESVPMMIDGGLGEILRRQYLKRFESLGLSAVREARVDEIYRHIAAPRPQIFNAELAVEHSSYIKQDIQRLLDELPHGPTWNMGDYADLIAIRMRVPNISYQEQARHDGLLQNFMPLVQPSVLRAMFNIPVSERKNASLFVRSIAERTPSLARLPLVKSGVRYPFGLSSGMSWLYIQVRKRVASVWKDVEAEHLLVQLREKICDELASSRTVSTELFNNVELTRQLDAFSRNDAAALPCIDWWWTFRRWQSALRVSVSENYGTDPRIVWHYGSASGQ